MKKRIKKKKLKCVQCGARIGFNEEWTEEKAKDEYKKNYPFDENMETEYDSLCEDCYNEYMKWHNALTPEEYEAIKLETKKPSIDGKIKERTINREKKEHIEFVPKYLIRVEASMKIYNPYQLKFDRETGEVKFIDFNQDEEKKNEV